MKMNKDETEEQLHRVTVLLCDAIMEFNNVNVMPSVKSLEEMFVIAGALFFLELVLHLFGVYTFVSVWGAGINFGLMTALMLKEKHDDNVIKRSYAQAKRRIQKELNKYETKGRRKGKKRKQVSTK